MNQRGGPEIKITERIIKRKKVIAALHVILWSKTFKKKGKNTLQQYF